MDEEAIDEIMARVRKLEIRARRLVKESFSGEYHSSFKGQGLDFDEHREYQHGDEVRFIDWNVTARTGEPFIRTFREERELNVILAVDISASSLYGSHSLSKRELAAEIAAVLAFSAQQNGDKTGLLLFSAEPGLFIPPTKGTRNVLRLVREILAARPADGATSIKNAAEHLLNSVRKRSLVFLISDFFDHDYEKTLAALSRKHEVICLRLTDPAERKLPDAGKVTLVDPETQHLITVNTSNANVRSGYEKLMRRQREGVRKFFKRNSIDSVELSTHRDYLPSLHRLFRRRAHRRTQ